MTVVYTAAHGGYAAEKVPLGGGAAVCDQLVAEWSRTQPFSLELVTPAILAGAAPAGWDLVRFGEREYARFCRDFERAATREILRHDPASTVVLANDVSEGPDFAALGERGYRIFTIYHVDVVEYVTNIYLRGWVKPETTVRWHKRLRPILPSMASLVWDKQAASVRHSRGLIVPSAGMRNVLRRCYPEVESAKVHVLPWGWWERSWEPESEPENTLAAAGLRVELGIHSNARVLLMLSRISPEKGHDVLLNALLEWERRDDYPSFPIALVICGDAAYMQGNRYLEKVRALAARLRRTQVVFAGHVTGDRKRSFFALADLYVFPSRHESYGLTLVEALAAGLPAVCVDSHGAREVMREEFGTLVEPRGLRRALAEMLAGERPRQKMGDAARAYARTERFQDRAAQLAALLML